MLARSTTLHLRVAEEAAIFSINRKAHFLNDSVSRRSRSAGVKVDRNQQFQIEGIVPVIPTPFHPDEEIDWAALRRLLDFAACADVNAVCLPAYASEFYKLTEAERREAVLLAIDHLRGRIPVIAQVNYPATLQAARSVREAQKDGASAVCCAVPRMFSLDERALSKHFDRILQAIDIPLIIQDFNPGGSSVSAHFVADLHLAHPHFRYVKLEEPLMSEKVEAILHETSGTVGVLEGWGGMFMLELIPSGICGVMSGLGISDILARVFRLAQRGDAAQAYELFQGVLPQIVFSLQNLELYHHAEKLLLEARGIISGSIVRQVSRSLHENETKHIRSSTAKFLTYWIVLAFREIVNGRAIMAPGRPAGNETVA